MAEEEKLDVLKSLIGTQTKVSKTLNVQLQRGKLDKHGQNWIKGKYSNQTPTYSTEAAKNEGNICHVLSIEIFFCYG